MFVIGKFQNPRCFKNVKSLPCRYRSQRKSWMDSTLFEEWVRELDEKFFKENRKIALMIDNCPAHPTIGNLSNARLIFLPPNTTSVFQPMDQGVIKCFKAHYRRHLVRLMIQRLDQGQDLPKISVLLALQLLAASWNNVGKATIVNCFRKAKISAENQVDALEDSDDPFKALQENLTELRQSNPDLVPDELSAADVVDIDSSLITTDAPTTDKEILESVQLEDEEMDEDNGIKIFDEPVAKPTSIEVGNALETLQNLCLFNENGNEMRVLLQQLESLHVRNSLNSRKQSSILTFFERK